MSLAFGIFPVEIKKIEFSIEEEMDIAVINGIKPGTNFGVFYNDNMKSAAIILDSKNIMSLDSVNILTKEQIVKEKICSDFDVSILEKRLVNVSR